MAGGEAGLLTRGVRVLPWLLLICAGISSQISTALKETYLVENFRLPKESSLDPDGRITESERYEWDGNNIPWGPPSQVHSTG